MELDPEETADWLEALRDILRDRDKGPAYAGALVESLHVELARTGHSPAAAVTTPYLNTIPADREPRYPGDYPLERRIKSIVRWNAMAMVMKANLRYPGLGGHISTYASAATLYEVGYNHFFRGRSDTALGDLVYFQGHASPGIYARAFVEGRLSAAQLGNFRRELSEGGGLPSYPHPALMPDFWQFPTVSMGLGPIMAIYQARFNRYLMHRGLLDTSAARVWAFLGDGECDEPESLGALGPAAREGLDNLVFVVNCNLQRLDGPVRGNGKVIQELEAVFRGAGWNVVKVIWGGDWDPLLRADKSGLLVRRMQEALDGDYQNYAVKGGAYIREHFFGKHPELAELVRDIPDERLARLARGGHDSRKVYAAYEKALEATGKPTVILAKTIKGYGLGEAGEGRNIAHAAKKLEEGALRHFRDRFSIPVSDAEVADLAFYRPPEDSPEMRYLRECRGRLGTSVPKRVVDKKPLAIPALDAFSEFTAGSAGREVSTTMGFVRLLAQLLSDKGLGPRIVPIVPDEARTFGMEALFRQYAIYSSQGQHYDPVDKESLLYYREAKDGQIFEEGITEAGAMASFIAAGTSYASLAYPMIPFYIFYSMFGMQRVGDLVWAAADMRTRGFLMGATAGRTTLSGEGLQHEDGHSHLFASAVPNLISYDPAYVYELAVIVQHGLERMFKNNEDVFYYITLYNENYPQPVFPQGNRNSLVDGILRGMYRLKLPSLGREAEAHLFASGPILREALKAKTILEEEHRLPTDVWSVTSFSELRREALKTSAWNREHPREPVKESYLEHCLAGKRGVFVAASDYVSLVADEIAPWVPGLVSLGTDGFGRSDSREALRRFFKVDAEAIVEAALYARDR